MQQNIATQSDTLEIFMKLEASPIRENVVDMNQIQVQLANLTIQLQDTKKAKDEHDDLWCTRCHVDGHMKDTCPSFLKLSTLRSFEPVELR